MSAEEQDQVVIWVLKYVGVPFALILCLSVILFFGWVTFDTFTGFLYLLFFYLFFSSLIRIGMDLLGYSTAFLIASLVEKFAIAYRGKRKEYSIRVQNEFEVHTFEINKEQWERLEIGVMYQIRYLKYSRLVLNIRAIPALKSNVMLQEIRQTKKIRLLLMTDSP